MAEEVLRYSLSRCADIAVLLTDKALGGADNRHEKYVVRATVRTERCNQR